MAQIELTAAQKTEFRQLQSEGFINPAATLNDWAAVLQERRQLAAEAARLDLRGDEPPELTAADERILDHVWAQLAAQQGIKEAA